MVGLLLGWTLEFLRSQRGREQPLPVMGWVEWWEKFKREFSIRALVQSVVRRYRWPYLVAGAAALVVAKLNWWFETAETYWVWHSLWHCSIYGSAFLFLCATKEEDSPLTRGGSEDELAGVPLRMSANDTLDREANGDTNVASDQDELLPYASRGRV